MNRYRSVALACLIPFTVSWGVARGDEFDRIEGKLLAAIPTSKTAKQQASLTIGELDALPSVLRDSRAAPC